MCGGGEKFKLSLTKYCRIFSMNPATFLELQLKHVFLARTSQRQSRASNPASANVSRQSSPGGGANGRSSSSSRYGPQRNQRTRIGSSSYPDSDSGTYNPIPTSSSNGAGNQTQAENRWSTQEKLLIDHLGLNSKELEGMTKYELVQIAAVHAEMQQLEKGGLDLDSGPCIESMLLSQIVDIPGLTQSDLMHLSPKEIAKIAAVSNQSDNPSPSASSQKSKASAKPVQGKQQPDSMRSGAPQTKATAGPTGKPANNIQPPKTTETNTSKAGIGIPFKMTELRSDILKTDEMSKVVSSLEGSASMLQGKVGSLVPTGLMGPNPSASPVNASQGPKVEKKNVAKTVWDTLMKSEQKKLQEMGLDKDAVNSLSKVEVDQILSVMVESENPNSTGSKNPSRESSRSSSPTRNYPNYVEPQNAELEKKLTEVSGQVSAFFDSTNTDETLNNWGKNQRGYKPKDQTETIVSSSSQNPPMKRVLSEEQQKAEQRMLENERRLAEQQKLLEEEIRLEEERLRKEEEKRIAEQKRRKEMQEKIEAERKRLEQERIEEEERWRREEEERIRREEEERIRREEEERIRREEEERRRREEEERLRREEEERLRREEEERIRREEEERLRREEEERLRREEEERKWREEEARIRREEEERIKREEEERIRREEEERIRREEEEKIKREEEERIRREEEERIRREEEEERIRREEEERIRKEEERFRREEKEKIRCEEERRRREEAERERIRLEQERREEEKRIRREEEERFRRKEGERLRFEDQQRRRDDDERKHRDWERMQREQDEQFRQDRVRNEQYPGDYYKQSSTNQNYSSKSPNRTDPRNSSSYPNQSRIIEQYQEQEKRRNKYGDCDIYFSDEDMESDYSVEEAARGRQYQVNSSRGSFLNEQENNYNNQQRGYNFSQSVFEVEKKTPLVAKQLPPGLTEADVAGLSEDELNMIMAVMARVDEDDTTARGSAPGSNMTLSGSQKRTGEGSYSPTEKQQKETGVANSENDSSIAAGAFKVEHGTGSSASSDKVRKESKTKREAPLKRGEAMAAASFAEKTTENIHSFGPCENVVQQQQQQQKQTQQTLPPQPPCSSAATIKHTVPSFIETDDRMRTYGRPDEVLYRQQPKLDPALPTPHQSQLQQPPEVNSSNSSYVLPTQPVHAEQQKEEVYSSGGGVNKKLSRGEQPEKPTEKASRNDFSICSPELQQPSFTGNNNLSSRYEFSSNETVQPRSLTDSYDGPYTQTSQASSVGLTNEFLQHPRDPNSYNTRGTVVSVNNQSYHQSNASQFTNYSINRNLTTNANTNTTNVSYDNGEDYRNIINNSKNSHNAPYNFGQPGVSYQGSEQAASQKQQHQLLQQQQQQTDNFTSGAAVSSQQTNIFPSVASSSASSSSPSPSSQNFQSSISPSYSQVSVSQVQPKGLSSTHTGGGGLVGPLNDCIREYVTGGVGHLPYLEETSYGIYLNQSAKETIACTVRSSQSPFYASVTSDVTAPCISVSSAAPSSALLGTTEDNRANNAYHLLSVNKTNSHVLDSLTQQYTTTNTTAGIGAVTSIGSKDAAAASLHSNVVASSSYHPNAFAASNVTSSSSSSSFEVSTTRLYN